MSYDSVIYAHKEPTESNLLFSIHDKGMGIYRDRKLWNNTLLSIPDTPYPHGVADNIPSEYDVRKEFPGMQLPVWDQNPCGGCWAFSFAAAMGDRYCQFNGIKGEDLFNQDMAPSPHHIISCCPRYADIGGKKFCLVSGDGCGGEYMADDRSEYETDQDCYLHPLHSDAKGTQLVAGGYMANTVGVLPTKYFKWWGEDGGKKVKLNWLRGYPDKETIAPRCPQITHKEEDVYWIDSYYNLLSTDFKPSVDNIKSEILHHGPVKTSFVVYKSFMTQEDTHTDWEKTPDAGWVYVKSHEDLEDPQVGGHAVSIVGWGKTTMKSGKTVEYWIVRNSWGDGWRNGGYFCIGPVGSNTCGIEGFASGFGIPRRGGIKPCGNKLTKGYSKYSQYKASPQKCDSSDDTRNMKVSDPHSDEQSSPNRACVPCIVKVSVAFLIATILGVFMLRLLRRR
jgi:hypothetical protein